MPSLNNVTRKIVTNMREPNPGTKFPIMLTAVEVGSKENRVYINDPTAMMTDRKEITTATFLLIFRWNGPISKRKCLGWTIIDKTL